MRSQRIRLWLDVNSTSCSFTAVILFGKKYKTLLKVGTVKCKMAPTYNTLQIHQAIILKQVKSTHTLTSQTILWLKKYTFTSLVQQNGSLTGIISNTVTQYSEQVLVLFLGIFVTHSSSGILACLMLVTPTYTVLFNRCWCYDLFILSGW